jgi:uncharacterized protein (DUF924 family)
VHYNDVLYFWFNEIEQSKWWVKDPDFDELIKEKFFTLHTQAIQCELFDWRKSANGRLAEIIVLDQFSRNMFRDSPKAFSSDPLALALAQEAVALGVHLELSDTHRSFMLMPYMHSESLSIHETAVALFTQNDNQFNLDFEIKHKNIIAKFGRYPHRNAILDRPSTKEELIFLKQPGSSF